MHTRTNVQIRYESNHSSFVLFLINTDRKSGVKVVSVSSNSFNAMALAGNISSWLQITHATTKHYIRAHDSGGSQTKTHRPNLTSLVNKNNHIKYTEAQGQRSAHTQNFTIHWASPVYSHITYTKAQGQPCAHIQHFTTHMASPVYSLVLSVTYVMLCDTYVTSMSISTMCYGLCSEEI